MQELDRIYFMPVFRKKIKFLNKIRKRKRNPNSDDINLQKVIKPARNKKDKPTTTTAGQNVAANLNASASILRRPKNTEMMKRVKKNLKLSQSLNKKPLVKVSRNLRQLLSKYQIFIVRRRMINRKMVLQKNEILKLVNTRIWK